MYSFDSRVRYSEINRMGKLDIIAIINYFQDCSTFQSEMLDLGVDQLKELKKAWVLNLWQIEINRYPELAQDISIGTWSYGSKGIYGYRNFIINDANEYRCVNADSLWVLIDVETGKPIRVMPEDIEKYPKEEAIPMKDYGRKISFFGEGAKEKDFTVRKYHIDTNGHVNNGWYVRFALEYLGDTFCVETLRAEYKKSAVYEDAIYPIVYKYTADDGRKSVGVSLEDGEGNPYAKIEFRGSEEEKVGE